MLDLKFVRNQLGEVEQALKNRGMEVTLDEFLHRDGERRRLLTRVEELRHERNTLSHQVGVFMKAGNKAEAEPLLTALSTLRLSGAVRMSCGRIGGYVSYG